MALRSKMLVPRTNLGNSMMQPSSVEVDTLLTSELRGAATLEAVLLPLQVPCTSYRLTSYLHLAPNAQHPAHNTLTAPPGLVSSRAGQDSHHQD